MKMLVTGGTGFLGSHLVERLLAQGHEVRALARRTSNVSLLESEDVEVVYGDVEDFESLVEAASGIDVVFHAAGRVTPGWGRWEQFHGAIVKGTENMLAASAGAGCSRFLYVSTGGVYGEACEGGAAACEATPCHITRCPDTYYESAKLQAEEAVFDNHDQGRLQVSVVRPPAVYGPRDKLVADRLFRHVSAPIVVWPEEAEPLYSVVYVTDVVECMVLAATSDRAVGQLYNVAPPGGIRMHDFAAAMMRATGRRRPQLTIPYGVGYAGCAVMEGWSRLRRVQDMPYLTRSALRFLSKGVLLDGTKARQELGWEPKVSVEEGTRRYVEWRRSRGKA